LLPRSFRIVKQAINFSAILPHSHYPDDGRLRNHGAWLVAALFVCNNSAPEHASLTIVYDKHVSNQQFA
jgi:hypothetical protein